MTTTINERPLLFHYHVPAKPLSDFVGVFWYWQGHDVPYARERVLPEGGMEFVIRLGSERTSDSVVSGVRSCATVIERTTQDQLLGIHFKPGGAFPFLGFPFAELHNLAVTLADVWGEGEARRLLCRIHDVPTIDEKFKVLERWLLDVAARPLRHHPAVTFAMKEFQQDPGLLSSAVAADKVNLSQRRFIEVFRNEVGLTPKLFCRVQRFSKVIKLIEKQNIVDWIDVALSCGYFDQSHFIHDFQEFSGLTPSEYLARRSSRSPFHVGAS
jgi:AraC-like DNA-binding protein